MNTIKYFKVTAVALLCGIVAFAQDTNRDAKKVEQSEEARKALFEKLVGHWQTPNNGSGGVLRGEIKVILRGDFLGHTYANIDKFSKGGEAMIGFNSVTRKYQMAWADEVHMRDGIMFSEGDGDATGFSVRGEYDTGPGQARGRWRTEYKLIDDDHLTITGYRISIGDSEHKELEIKYERIAKREKK